MSELSKNVALITRHHQSEIWIVPLILFEPTYPDVAASRIELKRELLSWRSDSGIYEIEEVALSVVKSCAYRGSFAEGVLCPKIRCRISPREVEADYLWRGK